MDRADVQARAFAIANQKMGGSAYLARMDAVKAATDSVMAVFDLISGDYEGQVQSSGESAAAQIASNTAQYKQLIDAAQSDRHDAVIRLDDLRAYVSDVMTHSFASANPGRIEVDREAWSRLVQHIGER